MKKIFNFLIIIISTIVFSFSIASASNLGGIGPNNFFYFLDTAFEKIDLFFTFNQENKVTKILQNAEERAQEISELPKNLDTKVQEKTLQKYHQHIAQAKAISQSFSGTAKEVVLKKISGQEKKHDKILLSLVSTLPTEIKDESTLLSGTPQEIIDDINDTINKKQTGNITLPFYIGKPINKTIDLHFSGESGPMLKNGDIPFSGKMTPDHFHKIDIGVTIPVSSNGDMKIFGTLNQKNASRNTVTLKGEFGVGLDKVNIGGLTGIDAMDTQNATLTINKDGIRLQGQLKAGTTEDGLAGVEADANAGIDVFSGLNDNWYIKLSAGAGAKLKVFGIPIKGKAGGGNIKIHPKGIEVDGYLPILIAKGTFKGLIDQFGADISGEAAIKLPFSAAGDIVETITDGAICGWDYAKDGAKCGYESVKNAAICGTETVTNTAICGSKTVTNTAKCGSQYITSGAKCGYSTVKSGAQCGYDTVTNGAKCGYDTVTSGAKCGWDFLTGLFGGKEAKSCKIAKSCKVAKSCKIANKCSVPKSCKIAATCETAKSCDKSRTPKSCKFEKTCETKTGTKKYVGDMQGKLILKIKGSVKELKTKADFTGRVVGEYCFGGKCYGLNENIASFTMGPPAEVCLPTATFPAIPSVSTSTNLMTCVDV